MRTLKFVGAFFGSVLFFFIFKYILQFIFGSWVHNLMQYYWIFVGAGLIPAFIAKNKGYPFFLLWIIGTWMPIISIFIAISLDDLSVDDNNKK